jgi:hypothetical protein
MQRPHDVTDLADLQAAILEFERLLPGWWYTLGICSVSRDASCGPEINGPDADLLKCRKFDDGFDYDDRRRDSTMAGSLRKIMKQALSARARARR